MTDRTIYTAEQMQRLTLAHKVICAQRKIGPDSDDGRDIAIRLLDECSGSESAETIIRKFRH